MAHTDWHHLAEQATTEMDSAKLLQLVDELNRALQQNEQTMKRLENESL
jgi:RNA polymerase-binding transcription factor DksA